MRERRYNVRHVAAHYNRVAAVDVPAYWYYNNLQDIRMRYDTEAEANEGAADAAAYARALRAENEKRTV